jgi:hypothetical protein
MSDLSDVDVEAADESTQWKAGTPSPRRDNGCYVLPRVVSSS